MFELMRDMWGGWSGTRLAPRRFAWVYAMTWLFLLVVGLAGLSLGAAMLGGGGERSGAAGGLGGLLAVALLLWLAALFNISVKRGRDIGVPGFVTGILFLVLLFAGGVPIFASILLALVPADTVAAGRP
ncbi:hypothetical protein [Sphingomonas sp.]|uniref:hypothetical protein n=1 Tax=Sphingomonas sp. TaxID=28214 RepID=UPI00286E86D7|nr:hypothetical protein [Sphingomonas sp.]